MTGNGERFVPAAALPRLEYRVFMFDTGAVEVKAYVAPSLNVTVPVGVPAPESAALTVAVKVTD